METGLPALGLLGLIRVVEADECRRVGGCGGLWYMVYPLYNELLLAFCSVSRFGLGGDYRSLQSF